LSRRRVIQLSTQNRIVSIMCLSRVCPVDDLGNEVDLHTGPKWNLRPAKRGARMRSALRMLRLAASVGHRATDKLLRTQI
jgi:hypothetical protein